MKRPRLTYANVMSTLAVGLVLTGGTAVAANTIGSADIKNGTVKSIDLKNNDVKSVDIKNGQIKGADLAKQTKLTTKIVEKVVTVGAEQVLPATVTCKGRDLAVGSGVLPSASIFVTGQEMTARGFRATLVNLADLGTAPDSVTIQVVCLSGGVTR